MATGGPVESVSIKGRLFAIAADADASIKKGGFNNEVKPNGNGTARIIQTRVAWEISGLQFEIDHNRDDLGFLQDVANAGKPEDITITHADGTVYSATGLPTGDFSESTQNATASVTVGGPGKLEKQ